MPRPHDSPRETNRDRPRALAASVCDECQPLCSSRHARLLGGALGGTLSCLAFFPLDTIKVRMQSSGNYRSPMDCLRRTVAQEGVRGLYKGLGAPLALSGALFAWLSVANGAVKSELGRALGKPAAALSPAEVVLAAVATAPVYCAVLVPIDLVKVRLQAQRAGLAPQYGSGALSCVRATVRRQGPLGTMTGFRITCCMRSCSLPIYLGAFDATKRALAAWGVPPLAAGLVAGSAAGTAMWALCFPLDAVKTAVQSQRAGNGGETRGVLEVATGIYRRGGARAFYRGLAPALLRAAPANALYLGTLEAVLRATGHVDGA